MSNIEIRNKPEYQMTKIQMFGTLGFLILNLFRISDFGFRIYDFFLTFGQKEIERCHYNG